MNVKEICSGFRYGFMKNLQRIAIALIITAFISCERNGGNSKITCLPNSISGNVLAFYPFSKGTLNDLSGNNHHLINATSARPTFDRNGNDSCAFEFDNSPSSTESITTSATNFLNGLKEFSISFWYQPKDTTRGVGQFESLICRGLGRDCPNRNGQWSVGLYDCRKAVFGRTNSVWDENITNSGCGGEAKARTNTWSHLVATYNETGVTMRIYRNGVLQQTSRGDADCGSGKPSCADIGDLFIGKDFTGCIDDVIIFNKKLSQSDVDVLFNLTTCCEK